MPDTYTEPDLLEQTDTALEQTWQVIVWNDDVNTMDMVVYVLRKVLGLDETTATKRMREVHEQGKSMVASGNKEKMEAYVHQIQTYHIQATLEHPKA